MAAGGKPLAADAVGTLRVHVGCAEPLFGINIKCPECSHPIWLGTVVDSDPVGSGWRRLGDAARLGVDVPQLKQRLGHHGFPTCGLDATRACLFVVIVGRAPKIDIGQRVMRMSTATMPRDATRLFRNRYDAHSAAFRAADCDRAEVWRDVNAFQAVQPAVRR